MKFSKTSGSLKAGKKRIFLEKGILESVERFLLLFLPGSQRPYHYQVFPCLIVLKAHGFTLLYPVGLLLTRNWIAMFPTLDRPAACPTKYPSCPGGAVGSAAHG